MLICAAMLAAAAGLAGCAMPQDNPQTAIAVDCHGATQPCGVTVVHLTRQDGAHAMTMLEVPVSALPGVP
jgi:hypothetical protein